MYILNLFGLICFLLFILNLNAYSISKSKRNSILTNDSDLKQTPASQIDKDCNNNWENVNDNDKNLLSFKKCEPCPENMKCIPKIQCTSHLQLKALEKPQICDLPFEQYGYCCVTEKNDSNKRSRRTAKFSSDVENFIIENAQNKYENFSRNLKNVNHQQKLSSARNNHPEFFHNIMFHSAIPNHFPTNHITESAIKQIFAAQTLKENQNIPAEDFITNSIDLNFESSILGQECSRPLLCPLFKYRPIDGTCNNLIPTRAMWGAAGQPMERILPPAYEDGIWLPRTHSIDGSLLLSSRDVSRFLFEDINRPHPRYNLLLMQFGQFIAHDITQSSSIKLPNGQDIQCCSEDGSQILNTHFACLPISIAPDDEFYSTFNQRCMNFVRLALAPSSDCTVTYGKQLSKITHYLDGSQIYGSDPLTARVLRTFQGGKLQMSRNFGRDLLPLSRDPQGCGNDQSAQNVCFQSGDARTNQIISLTILHTIFAREHNRIADILADLNPHYSDETLYQETRKIVIAEYQHIIFNEWLPLVIGSVMMKKFDLEPHHHSYSNDYNPDINVAVTSEFTGAAFRFGHSTVDGLFRLRKQHVFEENIQIPDVMFNPSRIQNDKSFLNDLVKTLTDQPMQEFDDSITHGLSRFLFRGGQPFGLDLAAINIQRGRDHALRPYNDYLELIGFPRVENFNQFKPEIAEKLSKVYNHPNDIDLWVGGLLEKSFRDSIVGPTFAEIIADQFSRFRRGDRFFYENSPKINSAGYLNHDQLQEIRKITMSRILCDNLDRTSMINHIPPLAFLRSDIQGNYPIHCDNLAIPRINLEAWKT